MGEWRNNFISGFLGLLGISLVLFGIQQALNPATDALGRVLIIGGSLLSFGAWRFWQVSTTERTHHTTDHEPSPASAERLPTALAGMSIRDGFYLPLKIYAPLSIISYFNEVQNGCFDPFTNSCPQPPSYYYLPLIAALILALTLLANAWRLRSHERDFSKGLALGTVVGAFIFFIFMMGGFWGWNLFI